MASDEPERPPQCGSEDSGRCAGMVSGGSLLAIRRGTRLAAGEAASLRNPNLGRDGGGSGADPVLRQCAGGVGGGRRGLCRERRHVCLCPQCPDRAADLADESRGQQPDGKSPRDPPHGLSRGRRRGVQFCQCGGLCQKGIGDPGNGCELQRNLCPGPENGAPPVARRVGGGGHAHACDPWEISVFCHGIRHRPRPGSPYGTVRLEGSPWGK